MLNIPVSKSSKCRILGLIAVVAGIILLPMSSSSIAGTGNTQKHSRMHSEDNIIVPGMRVGVYKLGMSKEDVLKKLGKGFEAGNSISVDGLIINIVDDSVESIDVLSPLYKFANGLGIGDSEHKIKQAFGNDFTLRETQWKDFLIYKNEGLQFEVHKKNRTVMELAVTQKNAHELGGSLAEPIKSVNEFDDVSGKDLSKLNLSARRGLIDTVGFDQRTVWPHRARMPRGCDPHKILTDAMNPGLGVRELHRQGITGKGVNVAIIDQPLYMDHPEYAGKFVAYHDTGCGSSKNSMHGPGMASQLVGNRCGTAPGARVYYAAVPSWKMDAAYYADALDWIITQNKDLPVSEKIRVVSVSAQPSGAGSKYINQSLWDQAVRRAAANGILVLDCTWQHGIVSVCWLDPQNRESVESCTPGFRRGTVRVDKGHIHVPTAPRTVAQAYDDRSFGYAYDGGGSGSGRPMSKGGYSDSIPYAAGILALGWQVRPELHHQQMRELLFESAYNKNGAKIINPKKFILLVRMAKVAPRQNQRQKISREHSEANIIVPGISVGQYKLGMSKDDVLKELGEPKSIRHRRKGYDIYFDGICFNIVDDSVNEITVLSTLYKFADGLGVGDSEQKIKQAFGDNFQFKETEGKDFLTYEDEGLQFEIHKKNRTVMEISVTQKISRGRGDSLVKPITSVKEFDDVRRKDLSELDLSELKGLVATLRFNQKTVWPGRVGLFADRLLKKAMNPGLGIRHLHKQGITGKGVNVAIIDQPTYLTHPEFAGKIVSYHDTGCETDESSMHGPAVASLLVGTNCGTAPDARVYYAAVPSWKRDAAYYAKGLDWIIAQNEKLPEAEKIRVVSVSASPNQSSWANRQMWDMACARAEADGIMVLDCTSSHRGFIGRCWYNARVPESVAQCNPWAPPNREFRLDPTDIGILVPSSPRTTAEDSEEEGKFGYQYCGRGGLSWAIPYCAGVLAMGWQVNPELSPDQMRELLFKSAYTKRNSAKIINPKKFIHLVKKSKVISSNRASQ